MTTARAAPGIKVLLVEDDPSDARVVQELLGEEPARPFELERVERLEAALQRLREAGIDVVLLDLDLPDSEGLQTLARTCAEASHAPILVLSGLRDEELAMAAVREGAQDYLVKGQLDGTVLRRAIHYAIERKRAEANIRWLTTAVEQSPASVFMTDIKGTIQYVNPTFTRVTGYTSAEAIGQTPRMLKSGLTPIGYYRSLWETILAGKIWRAEVQNRRKNGELYWDAVSISPIRDARGVMTHFLAVQLEVTERKRAQEMARQREEAYRVLMELAPDPILVADAEGRILDVNARACDLTGFSRAEFLQKTIPDLYVDQDKPAVRTTFAQAAAGIRQTVERRLIRKQGDPVPVEVSGTRLPDGRVQGILRDITERKRAEAALRAHERQLQAIVEAVNDIVFEFDADGRYLNVWAADERKLARPKAELMGRLASEVLGEEGARPFVERFRRVFETGIPETVEYSLTVPGGDLHFLATIKRLAGAHGAPDTVCMGIADVTERKRAEEASRASDLRLLTLFETVNLIVLGLDADARVNYVNPFYLRLTGYSREEVLGRSWFDFVPERLGAGGRVILRELLEQELHAHSERVVMTKAGKERMIAWNNTVVRDAQGRPTGTLSIGEDITERVQLEEQLRQAQKMEAVGRLAGGVAHDFNNLLTAITGYTDMVHDGLDPGDRRRDDLDEVLRAAGRAAALTRQLLAFSRRQVLQPRVLNLNEVVTGMEKLLRRTIGEDVVLDARLAPDLPGVRADPGQLEQVILNLAVNSRDAMPGGGRLTIETSRAMLDEGYAALHQGVRPGGYLLMAITDTGHGMDQETQRHVFEPFFTTKAAGQGTGLGLATVYGIVKQSEGHVAVYSEVGVGTTMKVYLPVTDEAAERAAPLASEAPPRSGTETVLLVEDEEGVAALACRVLERRGYTVLRAREGAEAVAVGRAHRGVIDLLVTDVVMPGMGGPESAELLRRLRPGLRVLFVSGYADQAVTGHRILDPNVPYLQKPFTPESLARKVREVLDTPPPAA
jgi:PAS domain S-box-containing protein